MDIDSIRPGQNFAETIRANLPKNGTFLAVIGRQWLECLKRREFSSEVDYVIQEIMLAKEIGIPIIPVLVEESDDLRYPDRLPPELRFLQELNHRELRHSSFERDVDDLVKTMPRGAQMVRLRAIRNRTAVLALLMLVLAASFLLARSYGMVF